MHSTDDLPHPVGQRFGLFRRKVDPDRGGSSGGTNHTRLIGAFHGGPAFKGGAARIAHIHFHQHIAWVFELLVEVAKGIDDHRTLAFRVGLAANGEHPVDPNGFDVTEVAGVVEVAHRIHVAPANRNMHRMDELLALRKFELHAPKPSSAAITAPLTKWLSPLASMTSNASRSSGLPMRFLGSSCTSFFPCSVSQCWWLISVSI